MKKTIRLDRYIAGLGIFPRRKAQKIISSGSISIDGEPVFKSDTKITYGQTLSIENGNDIEKNIDIEVKEFVYLLLHKPAGYVCSEIDEGGHKSYKYLLSDCPYANMLHVAGRLDFDTEGLVICTNDGQFTHNIISPKKHLEKEYYVETSTPLDEKDLQKLEEGVILEDGYKTLPAKAKFITIDDNTDKQKIILTITEGKFHQVKRMIQAVGSEVTYLRRDRIGNRNLQNIPVGKRQYVDNM